MMPPRGPGALPRRDVDGNDVHAYACDAHARACAFRLTFSSLSTGQRFSKKDS